MKHSLTKKTILLVVCIGLIVGTLAIAIYNKCLYDVIISQYEHYSINVAKLVAVEIDSERLENVRDAIVEIYEHAENKVMSDQWGTPEFEEYVSQFEPVKETDDYQALFTDLQRMQDELDVDCLYLTWVDVENECYVYLVDTAHEDPCPPGCIDPPFQENAAEEMKDLSDGEAPNITKTEEYGWLMSTGMPVFDSQGEVVALAAVDISMNKAMSQLKGFMIIIGVAFFIMILLVCALALFLINRFIVKPVNTLSRAASSYKDNKNAFSELRIKRNDEIGALADSMVQMEKDIDGYIKDLISAREHADEMDRMANMDALTGVGNKRAYDMAVKRLKETKSPYGIVLIDINGLKGINDNYGHEKGDRSIKAVAGTICRVFNSSAVYRIGGDEFVVILENEDYENRETLIKEYSELFRSNAADDSLSPWERVSAAIGYAIYDPDTDKSVKSVLQRADNAMYENKKAVKEEQ